MFSTTDLLVGVDIHRRTNVVQVMDGTGQLLSSQLRVANNRSGTAVLVNQLAQTAALITFMWRPKLLETIGYLFSANWNNHPI